MHLLRCWCAAGCGLIGVCAAAVACAEDVPNLVAVSARSEYPDVSRMLQHAAADLQDEPEPASYLQYEPQNVPLATDPTPLVDEVPSLAAPFEPSPQSLPPIVPYSTQFVITWNSGSGDTLGMVDFDLREVLVFPRLNGFMVTPGFASHILSGPESTDLPPVLYENWLEFRWLKKVNDAWAVDLAITPSLFTDYENTSDGAFRLPGRAIAMYTFSPELQLAAGVLYLNREDIAALPVAGLIWAPSDRYKAELLFPRPRMMLRVGGDDVNSRWAYLAGEFGGGSWAIRRSDQLPAAPENDVVTYSVLRFLVGYELKKQKGFSPRVEAGFSFSRSIRYRSEVGDYDPGNAAIIRFGGSF